MENDTPENDYDAARLDTDALRHLYRAAQAIAPQAAHIEAARRLPPEALASLVAAGAFKLGLPAWLGGKAVNLPTALAAIEAISRADASAGWAVMLGITSSLMAGYLDGPTNTEVFAATDAIASGVFAPQGRAVLVDGGFRVSGQWAFASGCEHAQHRMVGALVETGAAPLYRNFLLPAESTTVVDTWRVSGLCGTGSHDLRVDNVFVPSHRSFSLVDDTPRPLAPLLTMPVFGVLATGIAAVTLGIAHSALEALIGQSTRGAKVPGKRSPAQRELVQLAVAQAEAKRAAARAWLFETAASTALVGAEGAEGAIVPETQRARLRNAACHAVAESAAAVGLMYDAGGGSSLYMSNPLQRHFRDVHAAKQHFMVTPQTQTLVGRLLLGLESDTSQL